MSEKMDKFVNLMKGIFELDKSDLDFGIYRIMNIRKAEIEKFLTEGLPAKITETLAPFAQNDIEEIKGQIESIEKQASAFGMDISALPDDNQMKQHYISLKKQLAGGTDLSALESDVYSALYNFFNRYYDEGDFISKRRYKEGVYAIPYEGEEVKLYWANQDQYYIKTSENFKDYTFKVDDYSVHFRIVDATTEQNNNKESDDSKRVFMLFTEDEENFPGIKTFEHNAETKEIIIRFVYDIPEDKKRKYAEENFEAIKEWLYKNQIPTWDVLLKSIENKKDKKYCLLKKHLNAYVAKNTFDYFIHKDLKGFLTRELDFYIKSEIMHLDDLDTSNEQRVETYLAKVKAVKRVGSIIIDFLAQIEDFQKKLWLKKKFVIETNWCITLDRIDEKFYAEIIANEAQIQDWIDMYAVDEIKEDLTTVGFTNPPTVEFLRQNLNLVVDTKHFTNDFKERLIASIDNIDEETGGLMINSDNFQATRLIKRTNSNKVKCLYLDPPYNTNDTSFIYKNNYKHSSWASMISDRIYEAWQTIEIDGALFITIDDEELYDLKEIIDETIGKDHYIGTIVIQSNPRGRGINSFYATCHEYCLCYAKDFSNIKIIDQELTATQISEYISSETDDEVAYRLLPFRRSGGWSTPQDRPNSEFPLYFNENGILFAVGGERLYNVPAEYEPKDILVLVDGKMKSISVSDFESNYSYSARIMPVDTNGLRRVWRWSDREKILKAGYAMDFVLKSENGKSYVQLKDRIKGGRKPKTIWYDSKFDSSSHGTNLLKNIFGTRNAFGFPKSIYSTEESLHSIIGEDKGSVVLDLFGGSGTTGHAVLNLNRCDGNNHKYIITEMGEYFNSVTKPRMQKVIYSADWKDGKPQNRSTGISHIMKYMKLESYEDALSNISLDDEKHGLSSLFGDDYLINYMLDIEAEGSLLDLDAFKTPFEYKLKVTENNETKEKNVDVVETFNYLIGLTVKTASAITYFNAVKDDNGEYEGAVRLVKDIGGKYGFKQIEGTNPDGKRVLVIWRTISDNLIESNAALDAYFTKHRINPQDREYDIIYVNGDNNLQNMSADEDSFKVQMTELEFKKRMFEEE